MHNLALKLSQNEAGPKTIDDYLADGHTPMMAQYHMLKEAHPDCLLLYRMGDFYELFYNDAEIASRVLDITLTRRGKTEGTDIPMCGVPFHSFEPYLERLIRAGHKVGICEQTETPEQAKERAKREGRPASKTLVNREVVRIVTQGTLTEDSLLNARENNYLAALADIGGQTGLAWLELSTGAFFVQKITPQDIGASLERIGAREVLISDKMDMSFDTPEILTRQPHSLFDSANAQKRLENIFGVKSLESFGGFSRSEITAAGTLIDYVQRTQKGKLPYLQAPRHIESGETMQIDAATRRNLELTRTITGERKGSLLDNIDMTVTAMGSRLLQNHIAAPLMNMAEIIARQSRVQYFLENTQLRKSIREYLRSVPDIERCLSRLSVGRGGPRDLQMIQNGLKQIQFIRALLQNQPSSHEAFGALLQAMAEDPKLSELQDNLARALDEDLPFLARDGGFIRKNYHPGLDQLKSLRDESKRLIAGLQSDYQRNSAIDSLKIKYNNVLGYFIEVTPKHGDAMMARNDGLFIHRQTLANAVRFTTTKLVELERDIASAGDKSLALELEIFTQLVQQCVASSQELNQRAAAISALDVAASHADLADDRNYICPQLDNSLEFSITAGRHPVVESALKTQNEPFVPNDSNLSPDQKLWLLTGPNMAGKSTYLRQNALIAILAQIGSFVPASAAKIGIIDRVFSRVGASDDLARGRSTFMVEMVETAAILNQATERSLVILDEIGRGTATFDGLSIAWACVEHLHDVNKCRAIFATHYHELTSLTARLKNLSCHSMQVKEWKGDIIFMHTVGEGAANQSYGIHVGKLAGLPPAVIGRAQEILEHLQSGEQAGRLTSMAQDLPLFSATAPVQKKRNPCLEKLDAVNPDSLSPKEALELLYELKGLADE